MIKGSDLDKEILTVSNKTVFDLSGSAASEMVLYHKNKEIKIHKIWVKYVEATSANTGVAIKVGSASDDDAYFTVTSEVSKDALSITEYDAGSFVSQTVPKDTLVYISHAGSKTGTGTCHVILAYSYND